MSVQTTDSMEPAVDSEAPNQDFFRLYADASTPVNGYRLVLVILLVIIRFSYSAFQCLKAIVKKADDKKADDKKADDKKADDKKADDKEADDDKLGRIEYEILKLETQLMNCLAHRKIDLDNEKKAVEDIAIYNEMAHSSHRRIGEARCLYISACKAFENKKMTLVGLNNYVRCKAVYLSACRTALNASKSYSDIFHVFKGQELSKNLTEKEKKSANALVTEAKDSYVLYTETTTQKTLELFPKLPTI
eukprot:GHVH01009633.1.p2 GENE.GHVH01009633.1~~GHVH01009633.1.p2  ORF type:complete len:248 (+),score=45.34 GHVH01009633.1:1962-2705(+)